MSPMVKRPFQLENILLGLLRQGPQHGYSIHQQLSKGDGLGRLWRVKQSQVYSLLEKLESAGYITSTFQEQEPHPPRRLYALSEAGQRVYQDWVAAPVCRPLQVRQEFLAKLYFSRQEGEDAFRSLIEAQLVLCKEWAARLAQDRTVPYEGFDRVIASYRLGQVRMIQSFLEELLAG